MKTSHDDGDELMDPALFLADLQAKPDALRELAGQMAGRSPWPQLSDGPILFLGMGSSHFAASVAAARLRAAGRHAVAELAGSELLPRVDSSWTVVAVSAGGRSRETLAALDRVDGCGSVVALTNADSSPLTDRADVLVEMSAGQEVGGVACRSFQHTLALLLALCDPDRALVAVRGAAVACADLLESSDSWLPVVTDLLAGPDGTYVVAPARRFSSAQQAALMLREGPRRPAVACETGDWSHVDVYLTKTCDYRMLLFTGSRWEDELMRWTTERAATVVAVGAAVPGARHTLRYRGDDDDDVRLLSEVLIGELVAARLWEMSAP